MRRRRGLTLGLIAAAALLISGACALAGTFFTAGIVFKPWLEMLVGATFIALLAAYALIVEQWVMSPSFVVFLLTLRSWHLAGVSFSRVWNVLQVRAEFVSLTDRWCRGDTGNKLALNAYMDGVFAGLDIHWRDVLAEREVLITLPMSSMWSLRHLHRIREVGRKTGVAIHRRDGVH